ncbi:putative PurR-regulated permease PerM [Paucimonas lemoignei]|uniref:Putative PurR-regulated permease PerM n=1 Tax=Paucimonas lemoignei TaxID=29443 RepID=A0A4R3HWJ0_PAULE|nr:AI-2E family transporter [Paucimonas lemoignei]TCS36953.1 putative PurR-regulated permease PerM [Paucimonas lemoignei]
MGSPELQNKTFVFLLIAVSIAFAWILRPFFFPIFWGAAFAILFAPLFRKLLVRFHGRRNIAAAVTLLICVLMVIFPLSIVVSSLINEGTHMIQQLENHPLDLGLYVKQFAHLMPSSLERLLERMGWTDTTQLQTKLSTLLSQGGQLMAQRVFNIGQGTFDFLVSFAVMLYLLFFLLRDGATVVDSIRRSLPLSTDHQKLLIGKFTTVLRATVKGNIVVAIVQGALGGLIFWILGVQGALLWGTVMAFLSLLPAIGAALVWLPVAIFFLFTGLIWQGVTLILFGSIVIGLVDNLLRPLLVGKDTQMPDYLVLISTLGGMALFGLTGFVLGPVVAALFIAAWDLFRIEKEYRKA